MNPSNEREQRLFSQALERSAGAERNAFLDLACGADQALRQRLAELLQAYENPSTSLEPEESIGDRLRGWSAPTPEQLKPHFPHLNILELIGAGGMGAVYKAVQPNLKRLVALKILPLEIAAGAASAERFNREAQALARLSHQFIVTIYEFGQSGAYYFLVMEYVEGTNLRKLIRDKSLKPQQALEIVVQICEALQFAHGEKIVHRDIKPENILISAKGQVKIVDFGLAKLMEPTSNTSLTGSQMVMGTPDYMAPEQREKPGQVDHRADIYSLGVVFYEMLTGQVPKSPFEPPSRKVKVDVRLDKVVLNALEREPERRYQHVSEVKSKVESIAATSPKKKSSGFTRHVIIPAFLLIGLVAVFAMLAHRYRFPGVLWSQITKGGGVPKIGIGASGLPGGMTPETVIAMIKTKGEQFDPPDSPITASGVINAKLISLICGKFGQPDNTNVFMYDLYMGEAKLLSESVEILRRDGVSQSNIDILFGMSGQGEKGRERMRLQLVAYQQRLDELNITMPPPRTGNTAWSVPLVAGGAYLGDASVEYSGFISELVNGKVRTKPCCHYIWVSPDHETTMGEIAVDVFAQGNFPIEVVPLMPTNWIDIERSIIPYKYEGKDVGPSLVRYKNSKAAKIRAIYNWKQKATIEDAVYFSNDRGFVAVRLRAYREAFDELEKNAFLPFLDSISVDKPIPSKTNNPASKTTVNENDIFSIQTQNLLADLAVRLEKNPSTEAYMFGGGVKYTNADGSRDLTLIWNSAASNVFPEGMPLEPTVMELLGDGAKFVDASFKSNGLAIGYKDDAVYILNAEIDMHGRKLITSFAKDLAAARIKNMTKEEQDVLVNLAKCLQENPGVQACLVPGKGPLQTGSTAPVVLGNSAASIVFRGSSNAPPMVLKPDDNDIGHLIGYLKSHGCRTGYNENTVYIFNWKFGLNGRMSIIDYVGRIEEARRRS